MPALGVWTRDEGVSPPVKASPSGIFGGTLHPTSQPTHMVIYIRGFQSGRSQTTVLGHLGSIVECLLPSFVWGEGHSLRLWKPLVSIFKQPHFGCAGRAVTGFKFITVLAVLTFCHVKNGGVQPSGSSRFLLGDFFSKVHWRSSANAVQFQSSWSPGNRPVAQQWDKAGISGVWSLFLYLCGGGGQQAAVWNLSLHPLILIPVISFVPNFLFKDLQETSIVKSLIPSAVEWSQALQLITVTRH